MSDNLDELGVNGEFEENGREIVLDTSGEAELTEEASDGIDELRETIAQQDSVEGSGFFGPFVLRGLF